MADARPRGLIVAAAASHSGKTVVSTGLIAALRRRGLKVAAAKCGPDYIDPRFLDHLAQSGGAGVEHVVMSGGGAKLKNLRSQLEDALSVPVDLARPLQYLSVGNTSYSAEDLAEVEPLLTTAIGLALGGLE